MLLGSQNLGYILYNVESHDFIQDGHLPLSTGAILNWAGFSQDGVSSVILCPIARSMGK